MSVWAHNYEKGDGLGQLTQGGATIADPPEVIAAVRAIQGELNFNDTTMPKLIVDGRFGDRTHAAVVTFQRRHNLSSDGIVGSKTAKALLLRRGRLEQTRYNIPGDYLLGQVKWESAFDFGAIGDYILDTDRDGDVDPVSFGLVQINVAAHPDITMEKAFDPSFALLYSAQRMKQAFNRYKAHYGVTWLLHRRRCWNAAILQHKNPKAADRWVFEGVKPSAESLEYVQRIRRGLA